MISDKRASKFLSWHEHWLMALEWHHNQVIVVRHVIDEFRTIYSRSHLHSSRKWAERDQTKIHLTLFTDVCVFTCQGQLRVYDAAAGIFVSLHIQTSAINFCLFGAIDWASARVILGCDLGRSPAGMGRSKFERAVPVPMGRQRNAEWVSHSL